MKVGDLVYTPFFFGRTVPTGTPPAGVKVGDLVYAPFFQTRGILVRKWMDPGEKEKWEGYLYNMEILTNSGSLVEFCMYEDDEDEWEVLGESG